jgi:hypothetical protein
LFAPVSGTVARRKLSSPSMMTPATGSATLSATRNEIVTATYEPAETVLELPS